MYNNNGNKQWDNIESREQRKQHDQKQQENYKSNDATELGQQKAK